MAGIVALCTTPSVQGQAATISVKDYSASHPMIISHRGSPLKFPEHSYAGYNYAMAHGGHFMEQDIILSKDGQLVDSHDNNLHRTLGHNIDITKSTLKEVDRYKFKNGERLHTLGQLFDHYHQRTNYVIETKKTAQGHYKLEKKIIKTIKAHHEKDNVVLQSFSINSLKYMHKRLPGVPEMALVSGPDSTKLKRIVPKLPGYINIVAFYIPGDTTSNVKLCRKYHKLPVAYVLDSDKQLDNGYKTGLGGLFTDNTAKTEVFYHRIAKKPELLTQ